MMEILKKLVEGGTLSEAEAEQAFTTILSGGADEAAIAGLLSMIQQRGATVGEVVGAARVMRAHVSPVPHDLEGVIDTCGTGGAPKTFNVSTAAALIAAGAGAKVAKHGNRSRTGRGSAEILMQLGVNVDASPELQARCLEEAGICFSFAIHHHPAMKYAIGPRRSLGFPTIFNLLGPLTNPAGADRQLIGVYDRRFMGLLGEALQRLGAQKAMIAHSADGLDELSITAETYILHVTPDDLREEILIPQKLGIDPPGGGLKDLQARDLDDARERILGVINNEEKYSAERDMACLNAAAALVVAELAADIKEGLEMARRALKQGKVKNTLQQLVKVSSG
ncbi:MAG TPA: anthranilate phosphoribosyltransferase [Phycisphaeraceae bacterium]|nr:anthranilate phosphoribosyltransferase [Phycisphaeraceae bacterium]